MHDPLYSMESGSKKAVENCHLRLLIDQYVKIHILKETNSDTLVEHLLQNTSLWIGSYNSLSSVKLGRAIP